MSGQNRAYISGLSNKSCANDAFLMQISGTISWMLVLFLAAECEELASIVDNRGFAYEKKD